MCHGEGTLLIQLFVCVLQKAEQNNEGFFFNAELFNCMHKTCAKHGQPQPEQTLLQRNGSLKYVIQ